MPKVGQMVFWTDSKNAGKSKGVGKIVSQKEDVFTLKMKTGLEEGTMVECAADELKPVPKNMKSSEITVKSITRDLLKIAREVLPASEVPAEQKSVPEELKTEGTNFIASKKEMTRTEALKKDKSFYAEEEDGAWHVFGDNSGFSYAQAMNKDDAEKKAEQMNKNKKSVAQHEVAARLVKLARALIASSEMEERTWVPATDAMKKASPWRIMKFTFKSQADAPKAAEAMKKWLKSKDGRIQFNEIFIENGYAVEWRPLQVIYQEASSEE